MKLDHYLERVRHKETKQTLLYAFPLVLVCQKVPFMESTNEIKSSLVFLPIYICIFLVKSIATVYKAMYYKNNNKLTTTDFEKG